MNKISNRENGFSAVEVVLVLVIVGLIGGLGYLLYKDHTKTTTGTAATKTTTKSSTAKADPYAGWNTYTLKNEKLTFKYPTGWKLSDTSSNGIDAVGLSAADGFGFSIFDAIVPGGDAVPEASDSATPVTFVGKTDYLVFGYARATDSPGHSTTIISGETLQTDPKNYLSYPVAKNVVDVYNANYGSKGSSILITMGYNDQSSTNPQADKQLTVTQATSDKEYLDGKLVVESMHY